MLQLHFITLLPYYFAIFLLIFFCFFFIETSTPYFYILHVFNLFFFFFNDTATTEIYTLSLHDALPICTISTWSWIAWSCGPTSQPASRIPSRQRSSSPTDSPWRSSQTVPQAPITRQPNERQRKSTTRAGRSASSSRKNSPAPYRGSPFRRPSRGYSPLTTHSAPVRPAGGLASNSTSIPISSFPTATRPCAAGRSRRGRNRARPTTSRRCSRSASTTNSASTANGRSCPRKHRSRSSTTWERNRPSSSQTEVCAPTRPKSRSRAL